MLLCEVLKKFSTHTMKNDADRKINPFSAAEADHSCQTPTSAKDRKKP